uniref:Dehydrogenase n=1 Tax=Anopheles atroparvus TaxID=41427 RepID=A0A182JMS0_ANOAO
MERWVGKVAIVTGASSGIGAAVVQRLARAGMITVGLARRVERIEALREDLPVEAGQRIQAHACDVTDEASILAAFEFVKRRFGGVDVLINNAGVAKPQVALLSPGNTQDLRTVLDTNVLGLVLCTREAYHSMRARAVAGHIVNVNSIAGHKYFAFPNLNVYGASKYAVTAITETLRNDLRNENSKMKVTSISPGLVRTELIPDMPEFHRLPMLEAEDVAGAILYALGTPPHVQVHELIIKPVGESF